MAIGVTARTAILADSALAALIGTRVYPLVFPSQVTFPCITYRIISGLRMEVLSEEVYATRIQFDIWATTYDEAGDIKAALLTLFNFHDSTVHGQRIMSTRTDLTFDLFDTPTKTYRKIVDISMRHEEA